MFNPNDYSYTMAIVALMELCIQMRDYMTGALGSSAFNSLKL